MSKLQARAKPRDSRQHQWIVPKGRLYERRCDGCEMSPRQGYRALRCGTQGFALGYFRSRLWRDIAEMIGTTSRWP